MSKSKMFKERFSVRLMCRLALLIALEIVFNRFLSIRTPIVKIGFSFVPVVICACAFGPVWTAAMYVISDLVGTFIEGNVPLPGLTLSFAIMGFVFGLFLYSSDENKFGRLSTWVRIALPVVINQILLSLVANSFWLWSAGFYGGTLGATMIARIPQTLILIPVQIALIPALLRVVYILRRQRLLA